ncbi:MAG: aminotransferase class V-fold PLP-dependent enzyme [Bacteroidia bacterium]
MNKRDFLKKASLLGIGTMTASSALAKMFESVKHIPAEKLAEKNDFWQDIRSAYKLNPDHINLENGYYCILPEVTLEKHIQHIRDVNKLGAYYMRTVQFDNKKKMVEKLAVLAGCSADELIITRNATESLDMIIMGQDWKAGDEAVMANQDYGAMLDMFEQVSKRYGTVNKIIDIPMDPKSDEEVVEAYAKAITPKTKLLMICHMVNITGHILPVKKICDMAHSKGVPVMVDGAHAFAHIQFTIPGLGCDYYGSSLHKWLSVPLGAGMLYVKKEHIPSVWPIFCEAGKKQDDISRLNHTGTIPVHTDLAIADAIDFYLMIGAEQKETRLRYLQNYWVSKVKGLPNIILNTPSDPTRSCAIANVGIKNMAPPELAKVLYDRYKIYTVAIDGKGVHGCRITPNIFTTTEELDILVKALTEL